ncbi:damage-inducible type I toxin DinQ [Xenorhabdus anantnagensis]|uniref:damage-inducible type I toxin DinQ n=1 Tax=Xenorhabdus anantnagensis TaxID=3025875 RepID=UPI00351EF395
MTNQTGSVKAIAGLVALLNRSKRVKAFIDTAIIVLKALVAFLELIRTFLK